MNLFYTPTTEHTTRLSCPWTASYSGGKDSTSLVTWVEWLRRTKQIDCPHPKLVQSDTEVEYAILQDNSERKRSRAQPVTGSSVQVDANRYWQAKFFKETPTHATT